MKIFFDTEGVGLTGPLVTIQFSTNQDPGVTLFRIWDRKIEDTLQLIEWMTNNEVIGFNLVHDWFQLTKWYNVFRQVEDKNYVPQVEEIKRIEAVGPRDGDVCLKPAAACDLMLLARTGKYQYLAKHKPIVIRKVPIRAAETLIGELESSVCLPAGVGIRWRVSKKHQGRHDVVDIVGEFNGLSTSLKHLYSIISGTEATGSFEQEIGRAPYKDEPDWKPWGGAWEEGLKWLLHRFESPEAMEYARRDVVYTRALWEALGSPECGGNTIDDDSELACLVGATHWKGFCVSTSAISLLMEKYVNDLLQAPTSPREVIKHLVQYLSPNEAMVLENTKKTTLEELARWKHPVAVEAKKVLAARRAQKRIDILKKLNRAERFVFSMKIQGTLSNRMSGGSDTGAVGLNAQGIPHEKEFRELFPLAYRSDIDTFGERLDGGDFDAFEVSIADAIYNDPVLHSDLCGPIKIHAITGSIFYNCTPEEILATKGEVDSKYNRSKNAFFAFLYGAQNYKLAKVLDLDESETEQALKRLRDRYSRVQAHREILSEKFSPIHQLEVNGAIEWTQPNDYIESILGFRRYFTLEWNVIRELFSLASAIPIAISRIQGMCRRTNREQTISGAISSALYSSIFALQSHVFRAAANHEIQSVGGQITKRLQRRLWDLQPTGVGPWQIRPINIHDEIMCPTTIAASTIFSIVNSVVEEMRNKIPLIKMEWKSDLSTWGDK